MDYEGRERRMNWWGSNVNNVFLGYWRIISPLLEGKKDSPDSRIYLGAVELLGGFPDCGGLL